MKIFVTVGMNPWPFDRLLQAITPLCHIHEVFAQTGVSSIQPPCPHQPYLSYAETLAHIQSADVVITHAGNTVRLVQRAGKVPIVMARRAPYEMGNDHQVEYLQHAQQHEPVVALWDGASLPEVVARHAETEAMLLATRPLPAAADAHQISDLLDRLWARTAGNPFRRHPLQRYAYAWDELSDLTGPHLDIGCAEGDFLRLLAVARSSSTAARATFGVDPHAGYLQRAKMEHPALQVARIGIDDALPFPDGTFASVSMLDVLEHCPDEDQVLQEVWRVLLPDGVLVLTVPARHLFSWLDPDNAKFRLPRLHKLVYSARFGRAVYHARFVDLSDRLRGDMSVGKAEHTNYTAAWLAACLARNGFTVTRQSGANLFWRWFQIPALFLGPKLRRPFDWLIWLDGQLFHSANLFLSARKVV